MSEDSERVVALTAEVQRLDNRLRSVLSSRREAHAAEIRQANMNALRVVARSLVELHNAMRAGGPAEPVLRSSYASVLADAETLGLRAIGSVGEMVEFDRRYFSIVAGTESAEMKVLSPAFVLEGGEVLEMGKVLGSR